jgi:hypothetical protein
MYIVAYTGNFQGVRAPVNAPALWMKMREAPLSAVAAATAFRPWFIRKPHNSQI